MHIGPDLSALRHDDAPQRAAQAALIAAARDWRARTDVAELQSELAGFSACRSIAECPLLAALFEDGNPSARAFVDDFNATVVAAMTRHRLGHVAMRHFTDGAVSNIMLAQAERVSLMLVALDGAALATRPAPVAVNFSPADSWDHILAGRAEATLIEARPAGAAQVEFHCRVAQLVPGKVIAREGSRQALAVDRVDGRLVSLRLVRRHQHPGPAREYDLATGKLIHQSAGDVRESRLEFMVSLAGRMGRADAAPQLAGIALEDWGEGLRWEALRQCLGLDTATGFAALGQLANRAGDPLAEPARSLRAGLITAHPQLQELG